MAARVVEEIKTVLTGEDKSFSATISGADKSLKRLDDQQKKTTSSVAKFSGTLARLAPRVAGVLGGVGIGVGVTSLTSLGTSTLAATDALGKLGDRLDVSANFIAELGYAAELSDVQLNSLTAGLEKQVKRVSEAAAGYGEAKKVLEELGISAQELNELNAEQQFTVLADATAELTSQGDKLRVATKLWGDEFRSNINLLQDGEDGISALRQEGQELAGILTGDMVKGSADFQDSLTRVSTASTGLGRAIGVLIDGPLTELNNAIAASISWLAKLVDGFQAIENRRFIEPLYDDLFRLNAELERAIEQQDLWQPSEWLRTALGGESTIASIQGEIAKTQDRISELRNEMEGAAGAAGVLSGDGPPIGTGTGRTGRSGGGMRAVAKATEEADKAAKDYILSLQEQQAMIGATAEELLVWEAIKVKTTTTDQTLINAIDAEVSAYLRLMQAQKDVGDETQATTGIIVRQLERWDDVWAQMWRDVIDGTGSAMQTIEDAIKSSIAELIHWLTTNQLTIWFKTAILGAGGAGAAVAGQAGGAGGISGITSFLSGNSIATSLNQGAGFLRDLFGFGQGGAVPFGGPNWGYGLSGLLGGVLGQQLFGGFGGIGGGIGSSLGFGLGAGGLGSALGLSAAIGGPIGAVIGGLLGGGLGGLFGGEEERAPRLAISGRLGNVRAAADDLEKSQTDALIEVFREFDRAFISVIGDAAAAALDEVLGDFRGNTFDLRHEYEAQQAYQQRMMTFFYQLDKEFARAFRDLPPAETMEQLAQQIESFLVPLGDAIAALRTIEGVTGAQFGDDLSRARAGADIAEQLGAGTGEQFGRFFQQFYSEQERAATIFQDALSAVIDFNDELDVAPQALIDTKDELRDFVDGLDLTTEAGRGALVTALSLGDAITTLTNSLSVMMSDLIAQSRDLSQLSADIPDIFGNTRETLETIGLTADQLYDRYRDIANEIAAGIPTLESASEIRNALEEIDSIIGKALSTRAEEQQIALADPLIKFIDDTQTLAANRVAQLQQQLSQESEALASELAQAAASMISAGDAQVTAANIAQQAALILREAAANIPSRIEVDVVGGGFEVGV